jgi:hypothetical protein
MDYIVSEEKLENLMIKFISSMEIEGLYRVGISISKFGDVFVVLFYGKLKYYDEMSEDKETVENGISQMFSVKVLVLVAPYDEKTKVHLNGPQNIFN